MDNARLAELAIEARLASPSLVVHRLAGGATGPNAEVEPAATLSPASMIKVPLAAALAARWAEGSLAPHARVTVTAQNMTANDAASPLVSGYAARLDELARLMLARSDNVATNVLIDVVGRERATAFAQAQGLHATAFRRKLSGSLPLLEDPEATGRNAHPAADAARLFEAIAAGAVPGATFLYDALAAQEWNDKLSGGLVPGDRFAHKTGETDEVSHDGGILDTVQGSRYVIVAYTALPASPDANARLAHFMRLLRPYLI